MKRCDYITAKLVNRKHGEDRQGIFTKEDAKGEIQVQGERGVYQCLKEGAVVIPDSHLLDQKTRHLVNTLRQHHCLEWYGTLDYPKA